MKPQLKPYPMYKPSHVPTVGRIPPHCQVKCLGHIGKFSKGSGGNKDDEVPEGVKGGGKRTTELSQPDHQAAHVAHFMATVYTLVHYLMTGATCGLDGHQNKLD